MPPLNPPPCRSPGSALLPPALPAAKGVLLVLSPKRNGLDCRKSICRTSAVSGSLRRWVMGELGGGGLWKTPDRALARAGGGTPCSWAVLEEASNGLRRPTDGLRCGPVLGWSTALPAVSWKAAVVSTAGWGWLFHSSRALLSSATLSSTFAAITSDRVMMPSLPPPSRQPPLQ